MSQKRGNGEGSIGQYKGRWVARYTLPDGRRRALYGATRSEVAQKLAAAIRDRDAGIKALDERTTLGAYLLQWLELSVKGRNRPSTYVSYAGHVRVHLIPALGSTPLARLSPAEVERFMAQKLADGLTPSTVARIRATLRRALTVAVRRGLIDRNAAALADAPRIQPRQFTPLTADEARLFLETIKGNRLEALFVVALTTGLRRGELLGLTWESVDFPRSRITVRQALQKIEGTPALVEPKTAKSKRTVTVPPMALEQLRSQRDWHATMQISASQPWNKFGLVFTSVTGTPLDGSNVTRVFQKLLSEAGLPRIRFHDLRHTCASLLLAQGTHMRVIMEQLGHSQISLTMNTYSHVMPEALDDAADLMQDILKGSQSNGST